MVVIEQGNIKKEHLNGVYEELATLIGLDVTLQIYLKYKGQQISFPSRLFSKQYIENQIISEFTGNNWGELARKYDYTERWVREIIRQKGKSKRK